MIGRRIAHYEILEKLGQGGMGEVYRAHDEKLDREVALKVLPEESARDPERRARFLREARAIAALKHPNIVTIYSVEEAGDIPFLTMELVEGHSLATMIPPDGLRLDHFFNYAIPLADAIGWAHDRGITHRDLKPGNIMIDRDHRVKVLDFGLAKLFAPESDMNSAVTVAQSHDTAAGRILGTPAYMSPEQAEGKAIDHRSDIFSLGIVLYEMATGRRPFQGDTPISTISSILKDQPKSVTDLKPANPRELGRIVSHCLEKDAERRFQSAKDVRNQLEGLRKELDSGEIVAPLPSRAARPAVVNARVLRVAIPVALVVVAGAVFGLKHWGGTKSDAGLPPVPAAPGAVDRQMAVVFPFQNLGPAEDEYFAAGISEEINSRLASVSGLGVISRTSAENYDRNGKTTKQIGADLGVDYVLDGSVRWAKSADGKGRVRITPQLVRVSDDTPMWTETYDREVSDIFDVQTDIATHVVDALGVTLQGGERESLAEQPTSNVEAYKLYLRTKDLVCSDFGGCDRQIVKLLNDALKLDPNFLLAWSDLAREHAFMYHTNTDRTEARLSLAKAALQHAEAIDPGHPITRLTRGYYLYHGYRDYDRALVEFQAAADARPNDAETIFAVALIHRRKGDLAACVREMERAIELDPKNALYILNLADTYDALRDPKRAWENFERAFTINHDPTTLSDWVISSLRYTGDPKEAHRLLARATDPNAPALLPGKVWTNMIERDFAGGLATLRAIDLPPGPARASIAAWIGILEKMSGSKSAGPALEDAVRQLEAALHDAPGDYTLRIYLGHAYAYLGRSEDAIREARLAVDVVSKDAYAAPQTMNGLAVVYAQTGHADEAIELIERLLGMTYDDSLTIVQLRTDPQFDPLRDNPRFKALLKRSV